MPEPPPLEGEAKKAIPGFKNQESLFQQRITNFLLRNCYWWTASLFCPPLSSQNENTRQPEAARSAGREFGTIRTVAS
jgi:hypothetical protein